MNRKLTGILRRTLVGLLVLAMALSVMVGSPGNSTASAGAESIGTETEDGETEASSDTEVEAEEMETESEASGTETEDVGEESDDAGTESEDVGAESEDAGTESEDIGTESEDAGIEDEDRAESGETETESEDTGTEEEDTETGSEMTETEDGNDGEDAGDSEADSEESEELEEDSSDSETEITCSLILESTDCGTYGDEKFPISSQDMVICVEAETSDSAVGLADITVEVTVGGTAVDAEDILEIEDETITDGVIWQADLSSCSEEDAGTSSVDSAVSMSFTVNADAVTDSDPGSRDSADVNIVVITVTVIDLSGGSVSEEITVCVDQNAPTVEISSDISASNSMTADGGTTYYYDAVRTLTVTVTEAAFDEEAAEAVLGNLTDVSISEWSHSGDGTVHTITYTFGEEKNATDQDYTFSFHVQDQAGNSYDSTEDSEVGESIRGFTVDMTRPIIGTSYAAASGTAFVVGDSMSGRTYVGHTVILTLTVTERNFRAGSFTITVNGEETSGTDYTWQRKGDVYTTTLAFSGDRDYAVSCSGADLAGNRARDPGTDYFTVDTTAPTGSVTEHIQGTVWTEWSDRILFGLFANTMAAVELTASDAVSGVAEFCYYISDTELGYADLEGLAWVQTGFTGDAGETVRTTVSLSIMNRRYVVYVRVTDRAGNLTYLDSDGVILDDTMPTVSITGCSSDVIYNSDVTVNIEVTDPDPDGNGGDSGVESVTYQVISGGVVTQTGILDAEGGEITIISSLNEASDVTVEVTVTDRAGNTVTEMSDSIQIDITDPEVTITGVKDRSANRGRVEPVILVTDANLDPDTVTVNLTGVSSGTLDITDMVSVTETEEGLVYIFRNFESDMDDVYILTASAEDAAGNQTISSITFSVNRNGSTYLFGTYLKELIRKGITNSMQDIVITEINVDALTSYSITYTLDGSIVTLTEGVDYEVSVTGGYGTWHQYVYRIYADVFREDGEYVITIYSEDAARNSTSNAGKEKVITFIVDRTAPIISLSDLEDGSQYQESRHEYTVSIKDNVTVDTVEIYIDDVLTETYTTEDLEDGLLTLYLESSAVEQTVQIAACDTAGNVGVSDAVSVLVTRNTQIQIAFGEEGTSPDSGTTLLPMIILPVILAGIAIIFLIRRRKGNTE